MDFAKLSASVIALITHILAALVILNVVHLTGEQSAAIVLVFADLLAAATLFVEKPAKTSVVAPLPPAAPGGQG